MPTLILASSDVDANLSDLHALQSPEFREQATPTIGELSPTPWLREVGVAECRPVRTSRDVTSGRSSRPRHRKVLYFPHRHLWTMEYSCKVWCKPCRRRLIPRQHSRLSWRLRLVEFDHHTLDEALSAACRQEGEMEQYLKEKKASQKRPAATFQRQDKKKVVD
ncbi:hypothetical protein Taro_016416 [Colocasia esculenta]|uniref:Uncharacterized protein n=1 Tax=Colocasia esculenta TaxID=4460 RepID=A0A843UW74_COLES|nr:hypothetical protein [Colocasia esculenta]